MLIVIFTSNFRKLNDEKMSTYKDFVKSLDSLSLEACMMADMKLCEEDDVRLFTFLMPDIYTQVSFSLFCFCAIITVVWSSQFMASETATDLRLIVRFIDLTGLRI